MMLILHATAESNLKGCYTLTKNILYGSFINVNPAYLMESLPIMSNFAERLKQLRKQKGISQTELGKLVSVHYNHIGRYERGESRPSADALMRLSEVLGVSNDYLIDGAKDAAAKANFEDRELLQQFLDVQQLDANDKRLVKEFLDAFLTKRKLQHLINIKQSA